MFAINKLPPRTDSLPCPSRGVAMKDDREANPWSKSLNGKWKFHWSPDPAHRPADFYQTAYDVSEWDEISVPGNWQTQGYGVPIYSNQPYTFKKDPPHVMGVPPKSFTAYDQRNPIGSYRREFRVPSDWKGRRIMIQFDGVDAAFYLWVNGQKVGYSQGSRMPAIFDITDLVDSGQNTLAVEVYRYCDGSYLECQDMWRLSGIFRDVFLWSTGELTIRDYFVHPRPR